MVYYIIYPVSSAGDSHEQFPRSRSTHNIYVAAILTQSFIKSNYKQPLKLWQERVEGYAPHEKYCSTGTAGCMKALSICTCVSKTLPILQLIKKPYLQCRSRVCIAIIILERRYLFPNGITKQLCFGCARWLC